MDGPLDRLCSLFAPDLRFRIAGTSAGKPIAIAAQGMEAVRPWLAMLVKTFSALGPSGAGADGGRQARWPFDWSASVHSRITGTQVRTEFVADLIELAGSADYFLRGIFRAIACRHHALGIRSAVADRNSLRPTLPASRRPRITARTTREQRKGTADRACRINFRCCRRVCRRLP